MNPPRSSLLGLLALALTAAQGVERRPISQAVVAFLEKKPGPGVR